MNESTIKIQQITADAGNSSAVLHAFLAPPKKLHTQVPLGK
jgi:hypothetical protein